MLVRVATMTFCGNEPRNSNQTDRTRRGHSRRRGRGRVKIARRVTPACWSTAGGKSGRLKSEGVGCTGIQGGEAQGTLSFDDASVMIEPPPGVGAKLTGDIMRGKSGGRIWMELST